jgi:hypothetical protein
MVIKNPGLVLPIILLSLLAGIGFCIFILVRVLRKRNQPAQQQKTNTSISYYLQRFIRWLSEPTTLVKDKPEKIVPVKPLPKPADPPPQKEEIEVMRVLRVGSKGMLVLEIEGEHYHAISDINDSITERRIMVAIQELGDLIRMPPEHRPAVQIEENQEPVVSSQLVQEIAIPSETFVSQIEFILQQRLATHPEFKHRSIHISDSPTGDLRIKVDEIQYENIDDISEPEIIVFIRETLDIWERS